jgi:hypothetical protein
MKKLFTLVCMAFVAMSVNAQETLPEHCYPIKSITWGDITWKNGNNKKDKDNADMLFLMGTGNGYTNIYAEEIYTDGAATGKYRPYYTYIDYEKGETGVPGYGLYYMFTPKVAGKLRFMTWVNKGNRKTFVVKASTGTPLEPYVDYTFDGYVNGQNTDTDQPKIDPETGEQAKDNQGNPVWIQVPTYFTAEQIKARVDDENTARAEKGQDPINKYVIEKGNQAVWGWITVELQAGESYYIYQQSSQLGFGGYEFTPTGGAAETYVAVVDMGGSMVLASEFSAIIDAEGKATNVTDEGSVVNFGTNSIDVKACGGAVPTEVEPDLGGGTGIEALKVANSISAPIYNLAGQKVNSNFKGIVLQNGKKMVVK